ncbi:membrane protein [Mycobacterium sp. shizuoka-1]|nr:membrane protein [Mycobacterium sp. shizuoka-1]
MTLPAPKEPKPRLLQDGRDMFWSLAPLVVACIVLAGLVGMCSVRPSSPRDGTPPPYDAPAALKADAETLGIPIRLPQLPAGWRANSGARGGIDGGRVGPDGQRQRAVTSTVGYLAASKMYVSLTQSNADEQALVGSIHSSMYPTGTQDVDGVRWIVYEGGEGTEPVWTTRLDSAAGPAQVAITGAGSNSDFRTLAVGTQTQKPLPPG